MEHIVPQPLTTMWFHEHYGQCALATVEFPTDPQLASTRVVSDEYVKAFS